MACRHALVTTLIGLATLWTAVLGADERQDATSSNPIADFIDDETFGVLRINLETVQPQALFMLFSPAYTTPEAAEDALTELRQAGARELYFVASGRQLTERAGAIVVPAPRGVDEKLIRALLTSSALRRPFGFDRAEIARGAVWLGADEAWEAASTLKPKLRPELQAALEATNGHQIQLVLMPGDDQRRVLEEFLLPQVLGAEGSRLARDLAWASAGIDWPPQPKLSIRIQAAEPGGAKQLHDAIDQAFDAVERSPGLSDILPQLRKFRALLDWQIAGNRLELNLDDSKGEFTALADEVLGPGLKAATTANAQAQAIDHLKQIAIAMQNYHDVYKQFPPPAMLSKDGKPLLSWRVAVLPFFDTKLYKQFRLDEPWDSEHNKALVAKMPDVYRCPGSKVGDEGRTVYLTPASDATGLGGPKGIAIRKIVDGTSLTICVVEVNDDRAVPWTKPEDWAYDPKQPTAGLGGHFPNVFLAMYFDGSVSPTRLSIDPDRLRKLLTYAGREPVKRTDERQ